MVYIISCSVHSSEYIICVCIIIVKYYITLTGVVKGGKTTDGFRFAFSECFMGKSATGLIVISRRPNLINRQFKGSALVPRKPNKNVHSPLIIFI